MPQDINKETDSQQPTRLAQQIDSEPENIGEVFHDLLGIKSKFKKLKSFFRTRRLIMRGEYLFDRTRNEIKQNELMGPLTFNIYSSTIAATIALVVTKMFNLFFPDNQKPSPTALGNSVMAGYVKMIPHVEGFLGPFLIPVIFLFVAYLISWGTIRESDPKITSILHESVSNLPPSLIRGRNAFLYFDGAYGLIPQALLSFAFSVFVLTPRIPEIPMIRREESPNVEFTTRDMLSYLITAPFVVATAAVMVIFCVVIYQAYLTYYKYPTLLFRAHGYYSTDDTSKVSRTPWVKYILTAIFIVPLVSISIFLLYLAIVRIVSMILGVAFAFLHRIL